MFSDMLVYAKPTLLKKEYEYKGVCPFYTCQFVDFTDAGNEFFELMYLHLNMENIIVREVAYQIIYQIW